jgi:hypothetical protein
VFGGLCCLAFIAAPSAWKPFVPLLVLLAQIPWVGFVIARSRRAGITDWG